MAQDEAAALQKMRELEERIKAPSIWGRVPCGIRFEDLQDRRYDDAVRLLKRHYLNEEITYRSVKLAEDKEGTDEFIHNVRIWMKDKMSIAAVKEGTDKLVGVLIMRIQEKTSEKKEFNMWIIYLAAGVLICFLICCSTIIYKMKKRNCYGQRKTANCSNTDSRGSTLRKVNSSNYELHYSVPNNQIVNHPYYENINSDTKTDLTYAVLDLSTPDETSNKLDNERAIYVKINHNTG